MNDFPKTVLTTFASIGILSKLLLTVFTSSKDGSIGPASASIWGNLIIIFSLISYLSIEGKTYNDFLYPIYLIVLVLLWDTAVSYKYFERINKKEIPSLYYSWNTLLNLMLFTFVVLLIFAMFQTGNHTGNQTAPLYIIGFFSLFIMGIQQTILDNFMVDTDVV